MDISDIISDSIKYPSSNWGKVLILGIIMIASILIVPIFLLYGYIFRIIKATLAGIDELPDFDEIGEMFVDGIKVFVVAIIYAIPVVIISHYYRRNNWKFIIYCSKLKSYYGVGFDVRIHCLHNCCNNYRIN